MYSEFLLERYKKIFSEDEIEKLSMPPTQSIRLNTLKTTEEKLIPRLKKKGIALEKFLGLSTATSLKSHLFL